MKVWSTRGFLGSAAGVVVVATLVGILGFGDRYKYPVPVKGVVLVTGTASGIGHAITNKLASEGYQVLAGVRRKEHVEQWRKHNDTNIHPIILDITKQRDIDSAYRSVERFMHDKALPLSGVVNNVGINDNRRPLEEHSMASVREYFETNTFGPLAVTQKFLPLLRKHQGRLVFIGSVAGRLTQPKDGVYHATKYAIEALGDTLRQELIAHKVSVSLIEPGFVDTPLVDKIKASEQAGADSWGQSDYGFLYDKSFDVVNTVTYAAAGSTEKVSSAVLLALISQYSKSRYMVTNVAYIPTWVVVRAKWLLPDRVFDALVTKFSRET